MELNKDTKIRYTLNTKNDEFVYVEFTLEQIEGSMPNFYEQLKEMLKEENVVEIVKREIINKEEE